MCPTFSWQCRFRHIRVSWYSNKLKHFLCAFYYACISEFYATLWFHSKLVRTSFYIIQIKKDIFDMPFLVCEIMLCVFNPIN